MAKKTLTKSKELALAVKNVSIKGNSLAPAQLKYLQKLVVEALAEAHINGYLEGKEEGLEACEAIIGRQLDAESLDVLGNKELDN